VTPLPALLVVRLAVERERGVERARDFVVERARVVVPPRLEPLRDVPRDVRLLLFDDRALDDLEVDDLAFDRPDDRVDPDDLVEDDRFFDEPRLVLVLVWAITSPPCDSVRGAGTPRSPV
jgi:hypothetical protein